jgi:hypothetical protein
VAHLLLDGSTNTDADAPYIAAYDITGDLDVRVRCSADDWTPATDFLNPISRWGGAVNVFQLQLRSTGALRVDLRDAAAAAYTAQSTASVGFTDGQVGWIRFTLDVDNGASGYDVKFYTSPDGDTPTWTQLGATVTGAGVKTLETGSALMTVGSRTNGGWWAGKIYRAQVYDGIDGTLVFDADFSDPTTWKFS